MIVNSDADWIKVYDVLKNKSQAPLLCDGVRVLLSVGAIWSQMKLTIMPVVEGVYIPDQLAPIWDGQTYDGNLAAFVPRFYCKKIVYSHPAEERKRLKARLSKRAYENGQYDRYRYYYDSFASFQAFKNHYSKHFFRIELLESVSDALFDRKKQLPGGIGNALPAAMKALPAGENQVGGKDECQCE